MHYCNLAPLTDYGRTCATSMLYYATIWQSTGVLVLVAVYETAMGRTRCSTRTMISPKTCPFGHSGGSFWTSNAPHRLEKAGRK